MIEEHLDPTVEAHAHISNLLRTLVTAAAGITERRAQRREAEAREVQRRSETEQRAFAERINAERQAAELVYRRAYQDSWWAKASPQAIADAAGAAGLWAASDPRAHDAFVHIGERLQDRYGLDLAELWAEGGGDPGTAAGLVRDRVAQISHDREVTAAEQATARQATGVPWEAEVLDAVGPKLGHQIIDAEGWPHLQRRLTDLHATSEDVPDRLRRAVAQRELDSAKDKAVALTWRLNTPAAGTGTHAATAAQRASSSPGTQPQKSASGHDTGRGGRGRQRRADFADRQRRERTGRDDGPEAAAG